MTVDAVALRALVAEAEDEDKQGAAHLAVYRSVPALLDELDALRLKIAGLVAQDEVKSGFIRELDTEIARLRTVTDAQVERAAAAICCRHGCRLEGQYAVCQAHTYIEDARAALEAALAIREGEETT